jgi:hypothetical protein
MIKFACSLDDFWHSDLNNYDYPTQVDFANMLNGQHWHDNFRSGALLQSLQHEIPVDPTKFMTALACEPQASSVSWICIRPGQFIAPHVDLFYQLRKITNSPIDLCVRYLIFLEDWHFGQMVDFESLTIKQWRKGDVWMFDYQEQHWAGNASNHNFHTCQVSTIKKNNDWKILE